MDSSNLTARLRSRSAELMAALLLVQPILDVLSYFMKSLGYTALTTALRTVMLVAVCAYGFAVSQRRRAYAAVCSVIAAFWALHMLNCCRLGYRDPLADTGEYLKLVQLPLWTLSFVSIFRTRRGLDMGVCGLLACNFLLVVLVIGLSFATGMPEYTYAGIKTGLLGWFAVPTAQSAIVSMLCLGLLLWAWQRDKLWIFTGAAALGFGLLYMTATRLTYYSAILIAAGFLALIALNRFSRDSRRAQWLFTIPLLIALALFAMLRDVSPMAQRREAAGDSYDRYQARADAIMGKDEGFAYNGQNLTPELEKKIARVYQEVYGQPDEHGQPLMGDLLERFGTERVMKAYNYTTSAQTLYHTRTRKLMMLRLVWEDSDIITHILGFEYSNALYGNNIYDPENDFPALLYYYGWLGAALYCGFAAALALTVLLGALRSWRDLPGYMTVELGVYSMMFALGLGAAQFSGNVMRRPSVTVYMSLAAAEMYLLSRRDDAKLFAKFRRRPGIKIKELD